MRRIGLAVVLAVMCLAPLAVGAQQPGKIYRVGLIFSTSPVSEMAGPEPVNPLAKTFLQTLRALGYIEGKNLILERRSAEGRFERAGEITRELVGLKADVIVIVNDVMARAAKAVTDTVPIVMTSSIDPVGSGLAQSLARPGGNITGLAITISPEVEAKRLELLREMLPRVSRVAYLDSQVDKTWESPRGRSVRAAAQALGVTLLLAGAMPHEYAEAFTHFRRGGAEALFVAAASPAWADRALITDFATRTRLPGTFPERAFVEVGGLMSYGANLADLFRRAAIYVDKILKGAKPADLPVEQPAKFDLVINTKTAKALTLTIPHTILLQADQVIE
jgi:putative tryptophan/tyrosine transport system substrate-binding protein